MSSRIDLGPKPRLGYTDSRLVRAAELRHDGAAMAALAADPRAACYVAGGELVVLNRTEPANSPLLSDPLFSNSLFSNPLFSLSQAAALGTPGEMIFLGLHDGAPRFGVGLAPQNAEALKERSDLVVTDLRSIAVQGLVDADHLQPIAETKALLHWHARHRFCANCGAPTNVSDAGWRRDCPSCKAQHFPRTDPVVIMLAVDGDRCLLGRSPRFAPTMWSCLAGFVEPGESMEDAVRRETLEEAGIICGRVRYFATQPWPFPSSLMIGCHAQALSRDITIERDELEDARWFSRDETAQMLMRCHPDGLTTPLGIAIAYHIIRSWVEDGIEFD